MKGIFKAVLRPFLWLIAVTLRAFSISSVDELYKELYGHGVGYRVDGDGNTSTRRTPIVVVALFLGGFFGVVEFIGHTQEIVKLSSDVSAALGNNSKRARPSAADSLSRGPSLDVVLKQNQIGDSEKHLKSTLGEPKQVVAGWQN